MCFEDWHNQKYGCDNSCADGKQDDIAPAHIQTAIHFVSDLSQHAFIFISYNLNPFDCDDSPAHGFLFKPQ